MDEILKFRKGNPKSFVVLFYADYHAFLKKNCLSLRLETAA